MKYVMKYLVIILFFVFHASTQITYRQAQMSDSDSLMKLYETFDQDGVNNLLLFPGSMRRAVIESSIQKDRIFVAVNTYDNDKIVAFAKIFFITDPFERDEILQSELRIKPEASGGICLDKKIYNVSRDATLDFRSALTLGTLSSTQEEALDAVSYNEDVNGAYIYAGGMYTLNAYRGQGINSALLHYGFKMIKDDVTRYLHENFDCLYLALVYGQIQANAGQKIQIRPFAACVLDIKESFVEILQGSCDLLCAVYRLYKPDLSITDGGELVCGPDREENKGQGNILVACVRDVR